MGIAGKDISSEQFEKCILETTSRGPDALKIVETDKAILGFQRLSIMGLTDAGMQPFHLNGKYVVCNGELYGFRPIKEELKSKGYEFASDSDCEIILPMYEQYGTDLFAKLDAEYALIIYIEETGELIAARDPIGIRPLYYGYTKAGSICFASEPKALVNAVKKIGFNDLPCTNDLW